MEKSGDKRDALVRISQFIVRKESEALAKDCQDGLVKTILFNVGNTGLSVPEIKNEASRQMNLKNFPAPVIRGAVRRLVEEKGQLREESGKYYLKAEEFQKMEKTITERAETLDSIESAIKAKMQEKLKTKADAKVLEVSTEVLYEFLIQWFSSESDFVANIILSTKEFKAPDFPMQILEKALDRVEKKDLKQAIRNSILETFEKPQKGLIRFLLAVLQNYLHLELLNIDPECKCLQEVAFSSKTLILDTNILMGLLLKSLPRHKGTNEIVSLARDLGINLAFTKRTKRELFMVLELADEDFKAIRSTRPSLLRNLDDNFIRSYFIESANNPSLTWQGFYLQMRQIEKLAGERGIKFLYRKEFDLDKLPSKELFEPLSGRVYACARLRGNPKSKAVSQHDAYHLLLVRKLRDEVPSDMLGPSFWFLTYDTSLLCADEGLNDFLKTPLAPPSSFVADLWLTMIAPFLGPKIPEDRLAEAFVNLMKTRFATVPSGLTAPRIVEVLGHWLPYKTLSDADLEAIMSDALVTKYYEQLKEAHIKDPRLVRRLKEKLREEVDKKVYSIFDDRVASAQEERDEAKKLAVAREKQLLAERRHRKLILTLSAVLGAIFAVSGLVVSVIGNLETGNGLTIAGIVFLVLALAFRHFKFKVGPFEIEAIQ